MNFTHCEPGQSAGPESWRPFGHAERILVIEDKPDIRESLRMVLALEGHQVQTAPNGQEGLEKLAGGGSTDVVLIDIRMPGMNGYEVARRARGMPSGDALKLVAVTAYGSPRERARAFAAGFDAHVTKPCSYSELMQAIHDIPGH